VARPIEPVSVRVRVQHLILPEQDSPSRSQECIQALHITLATYNIHACIGVDRRFVPERTVQVLRELDADVIALQKVEHHAMDGYDLLDYLAEKTGLTAIAGPSILAPIF
jgi:hypothetical protein